MNWLKEHYAVIVTALGAVLIGLSVWTTKGLEEPAEWLIDWTGWMTNYVLLVVSAYAIVKLANGAEHFLITWKANNPLPQEDNADPGTSSD